MSYFYVHLYRDFFNQQVMIGNHEYNTMDVKNWMETIKELGVQVLHNTNVKVPADKADDNSLCFIGTDDIEADKIR